jgi:hypothetical protein
MDKTLEHESQLTISRLDGYFNGVSRLVEPKDWVSQQEVLAQNISLSRSNKQIPNKASMPPMEPIKFNAYEEFSSEAYLEKHFPVEKCFLDDNEKISPPEVFAYPGIPENMTRHAMGSYKLLGLRDDVCWDRFGRFGPYGYGYDKEIGGLGLADRSEKFGSSKIWEMQDKIDWRKINWGKLQSRCFEKNKRRFSVKANEWAGKERVKRNAYILRSYTGYKYDDHQLLTMRAMISELALKSGGEYDVHLLVQVKDESIPIYTDPDVYQETLEEYVPREFWNITTLWSEELMRLYYPGPFPDNFDNPSGQEVHGVYRGAHFPLFWFSQKFPNYDYYWNWEMDLRYNGHYYDFNKKITDWAKKQPRKGLWERNSRYYLEEFHGSWSNFTHSIEKEISRYTTQHSVWGPVKFPNSGMLSAPNATKPPRSYSEDNYEWGVGEDADYLSFNPLFDPSKTNWVFRNDVDGYSRTHPIPPRRIAIITVSRLSKRLMDTAHKETYKMRHTMFPEMWPPTIALHHGFKGVFIPHPVYTQHDWPVDKMNQIFNHPKRPTESVFGWGEHNQLGTSFYYHALFAGSLWRRWFGYREDNEGGTWSELSKSGRMCLRSTLFHPIKYERGPTE